jgi:hypothetical protein
LALTAALNLACLFNGMEMKTGERMKDTKIIFQFCLLISGVVLKFKRKAHG